MWSFSIFGSSGAGVLAPLLETFLGVGLASAASDSLTDSVVSAAGVLAPLDEVFLGVGFASATSVFSSSFSGSPTGVLPPLLEVFLGVGAESTDSDSLTGSGCASTVSGAGV